MFVQTFDGITKSLNKTVAKLHKLADRHETTAIVKTNKAYNLNIEVASHNEEVARARRVAKNISKLLGEDNG